MQPAGRVCIAALHTLKIRFKLQTESCNRARYGIFHKESRMRSAQEAHSEMLRKCLRRDVKSWECSPPPLKLCAASAERSTLLKKFHRIRLAQSALLQIFAQLPRDYHGIFHHCVNLSPCTNSLLHKAAS
jgi:hypothetical protein